jgi:hypothetical protein
MQIYIIFLNWAKSFLEALFGCKKKERCKPTLAAFFVGVRLVP